MALAPHRPEWLDPLLNRFGTSPAGTPLYQVVWSEDRLEWFFGKQIRRYGEGFDRWIIEKWLPCLESREVWVQIFEEAMGPYPENGDYEHCYTFEIRVNADEEPQFMPLRENVVELVLRALEAGKLRHTDAERKAAVLDREDRIKAERKRLFDEIWNDAAPVRGAKIPEHIQMMDSFGSVSADQLPKHLQFSGMKQLTEDECQLQQPKP